MKNLLLLSIGFALFVHLSSCYKPKTAKCDFLETSFETTINLGKGKSYSNDNLILSHPRWLRYHPDSLLIIQEMGTPYLLKIVDLKNGKVQQIIQKGEGTNQMVVAWGIDLAGRNLSVFDGVQKKYVFSGWTRIASFMFKMKFTCKTKELLGLILYLPKYLQD